MKNKFLFLLALFLSVNSFCIFLNSCSSSKSDISCGYYTRASLMAMDNRDSIPREPGYDGVHIKTFLLALTLWDTTVGCAIKGFRFSGNAAFATYQDPHGPVKTFVSVTITSDNDYDATHPAGTDLKDLFNINMNNPGDRNFFHPGTNNYYLAYPPDKEGIHVFTINLVTAKNDHNLTATSSPVKLLL